MATTTRLPRALTRFQPTLTAYQRSLASRSYGTVSSIPLTNPETPAKRNVFQEALQAAEPRTNWTKEEIKEIYDTPLMELCWGAGSVHRKFHIPGAIQVCTLLNIKTGGCSEDCSYCAQSSRYSTGLQASKILTIDAVLSAARTAKANGSTRFCMGAAWRDMRGRRTNLSNIKTMITSIRAMGMEVCVTLGMIDSAQAEELKAAGLTAYNHNVDTSREFYPKVITTRSYDERLQTIENVREAGIKVCTGGILGLGEQKQDHIGLLHTVSTLPSHPESFPVNMLVPIKGTPLQDNKKIEFEKMLRMIAAARIVMPRTIVRLAAGRTGLSEEQQVLCFMAGANAVFTGEKMLTTPGVEWKEDEVVWGRWGLRAMESFEVEGLREEVKFAAGRGEEMKGDEKVV
ncbi:biotin synthase protein [Rutstroemia sp. NJR-2017a WRK4]|nr:biotin synthase protein [Rutstroemia sp. NJR-2017a WRK4]